jgi:DNA-directed RNA polymerase subunit N (RpoN/RPB10)
MTPPAIDVRCPSCGYSPVEYARYTSQTDMPETREDVLDFFQVYGADEGCAFCPRCTCEFNTDTGELAPGSMIDEDTEPCQGTLF